MFNILMISPSLNAHLMHMNQHLLIGGKGMFIPCIIFVLLLFSFGIGPYIKNDKTCERYLVTMCIITCVAFVFIMSPLVTDSCLENNIHSSKEVSTYYQIRRDKYQYKHACTKDKPVIKQGIHVLASNDDYKQFKNHPAMPKEPYSWQYGLFNIYNIFVHGYNHITHFNESMFHFGNQKPCTKREQIHYIENM